MLEEMTAVRDYVLGPDPTGNLSCLAGEALTPDEYQVWSLVSGGWSDAQIADLLFLNPVRVRFHLSNAIAKLGAAYSHEAALLA